MGTTTRRHALLVALALVLGCGGSGDGGGCARIHQGDYTMPVKRIIKSAVKLRLTQTGADFLTTRVRSLIASFFQTDAQGRAVIALESLGLGELGTSLGPLDAEVRDLVVTLDLSALNVRFVPNTSPARLEITINGGELGLVDGVVAGAVSGFLFSGDVGCGLANGPAGRIALVDLALVLELDTDPNGGLDVKVLPSQFDLREVALDVVVDCTIAECLDGQSPPSTAECAECESLCPAAGFVGDIVTSLQQLLDGLFDQLLNLLADDVANLLLDGVLNGQPLAVEGTLDLGAQLGPIIRYVRSARPLGVLARPASDAFAVTGGFGSVGLDTVLDAGVDASPTHPCVGSIGADLVFVAGPPPDYSGVATLQDGAIINYDLGLGVSQALINEAVWAAYKSGLLCIDLTSTDLARLSSGNLVITSEVIDLLLPGATALTGPNAPIRVRLQPRLDPQVPSPTRFATSPDEPTMTLSLVDATVAIDVLLGDGFVTAVAFEVDLDLGIAIEALPDAQLGATVAGVSLSNLRLLQNELFAEARLDVIAPFVVDLALGLLTERPIGFELPLGGIGDALGLPLTPVVVAIEPDGPNRDWLSIFVALQDPASLPNAQVVLAPIALHQPDRGVIELTVDQAPGQQTQLRPLGGLWSPWFDGPGPHRWESPRLLVEHPELFRARSRAATGELGVVEHVVAAPESGSSVASTPQGCEGAPGGDQDSALPLSLALGLCTWWLLGRRRQRCELAARLTLMMTLTGLAACGSEAEVPATSCTSHSQCINGYLCYEQRCQLATTCGSDSECCPGAVCTQGWCRPTSSCGPDLGCAGIDEVCEAGSCVRRGCLSDGECHDSRRCIAGRCVEGEACVGGCPVGACHVPSGRCLATAQCSAPCPPGTQAVVPDGTPAPAHACGDFGYLCECAPVRSVEPPTPGVDGVGTVLPTGELIVVSYDPRYGDLVHSRFDPTLTTRLDTALDGFEGLPGVSGYRAGDSRSGLDHGRRPAIAERADGTLSVVYQVETGLGHMLIDPAGPVLLGHSVLPLPASTGRFQCAVTRRRPDGVEITAGYAFVADDGVPASTRVVTFESLTTNPTGAGEWAVQTAEDRPLPQRSPEPCAGACGLSEVCVSGGVCGSAIQLSGCPSVCGVHQVCASVGDGPAACRDRIYPETRLRDAVFGAGHHVACVSAPDGVRWLGAWQDRDAGSLRLQLGAGAPIVTVDGQTATDGPVASVGAHVAAAWTVAGIFVAYQDETAGTLKLAHAVDAQAAEAGIWTISTVHAATRPGQRFGLWTSLSAGSAGELTVVYGEGEGADIWLAHRDAAGCWGRTPVLTAGAYAFPSVTVDHIAQQAIVSALAYRFEPDLDARHAPVALRVGLPGCGTGMTP